MGTYCMWYGKGILLGVCGGIFPHAGKVTVFGDAGKVTVFGDAGKVTVFGDAGKVYSFYNKVVSEAILAEPFKVDFDAQVESSL